MILSNPALPEIIESKLLYGNPGDDRGWRPVSLAQRPSPYLNLLCPSLAFGGAERCVQEVVTALDRSGVMGKLFVLYDLHPSYPAPGGQSMRTVPLAGFERERRLEVVALEVLASPNPVLITHLIREADLRKLWSMGVRTIPVIHNSAPGWHDPPRVFDDPHVPFVIAVCESVASQLRDAGCPKKVVVLRHELISPPASGEDQLQWRSQIRRQYGIRKDTLLIGMVGQFKAHKAYTRAVRVLHGLQRQVRSKLLIAGGWDHAYGAGRVTYTATMRRALELGVLPDLIVAGTVDPILPYYAAFDIFLNTSVYEGMSIATMEAVRHGCPVVTADVGGQSEAIGPNDCLISDASDIDAYVDAIRSVARRRERAVADSRPSTLVPLLWAWIATYGVDAPCRNARNAPLASAETLFVTSNMNPGGAQRSLANLLPALAARHRVFLCILSPTYDGSFLGRLRSANVPVVSFSDSATTMERAGRVVDLAARLGVRNICFWNADAAVKLIVCKVHEASGLRTIDVSPGPMLFHELDQHELTQRRISMTGAQYFGRLDGFVAKYADGGPPDYYHPDRSRVTVVANGVPAQPAGSQGAPVPDLLPDGADPNLAVVTSTRIAPNKRVEDLLDIAAHLGELVPAASITVIGGVDPRHVDYWRCVKEKLRTLRLRNVYFAGPRPDVERVLDRFRVFVMISREQGCPNASLEAMAAGLPVVANDDGGTHEQVVHGQTGFLVPEENTRAMAEHIAWLLVHPENARAMGEAARRRALERFSMAQMVEGYRKVLEAECASS